MLISWMQKKSVGRGVANAASGDKIHPAADAATLDRHDHRNAQLLQFGEGGLDVQQVAVNCRAAFGGFFIHHSLAAKSLQGHAGAEMFAGARYEQHACIAGLVDPGQGRIQLAPEQGVHGVERLGPVEHQVRDVRVERE